jgi:hypothetical protein
VISISENEIAVMTFNLNQTITLCLAVDYSYLYLNILAQFCGISHSFCDDQISLLTENLLLVGIKIRGLVSGRFCGIGYPIP